MRDTPETWHPVSAPAPAWQPAPAAPVPEGSGRLRANWFTPLHEVRRGRIPFDARRATHWLAAVVAALVVGMLLLNLVSQVILIVRGSSADLELTNTTLVIALLVNVLLFIGAPLLWVAVMYRDGRHAIRERLFFRSDHVGKDVLVGIGAGIVGIIISYLAVLVFFLLGWQVENPVVEDMASRLTWGLVFFIPLAAATSEEVFFRGWMHPRIGIVPANVLFGFVHLSYQTPLQVLVPMALGFVLSMTLVWRRSLLPAVVAHFVFNFAALTVTKLAHDFGWDDSFGWVLW